MIPVNDFDPKRNSSVLLMGTSTARMVGCAIDAGAGSAARLGQGEFSSETGIAPGHLHRLAPRIRLLSRYCGVL